MERIKDLCLPLISQSLNLWCNGECARNKSLRKLATSKGIHVGALVSNDDYSEAWQTFFRLIKKEHPESAVVYFIENYDGTRVKIGRTKTLWRRFEEIRCTSGGDARIVLALPAKTEFDSKTLEAVCQSNFPGPHLCGEWYTAKDAEGSFVADFVNTLYNTIKEDN